MIKTKLVKKKKTQQQKVITLLCKIINYCILQKANTLLLKLFIITLTNITDYPLLLGKKLKQHVKNIYYMLIINTYM